MFKADDLRRIRVVAVPSEPIHLYYDFRPDPSPIRRNIRPHETRVHLY